MTELIFTARALGAAPEYTPIKANHLQADVQLLPVEPITAQITITAQEAFQGVIRIALPVKKDPRFFLPGVIYGTNRGEDPLLVDSNCPRLRHSEEFPASPWWMFRSDRLSHPCAFAWAEGRLLGLAASPYYVVMDGLRTPWEPGVTGEFYQYTGFGCTLVGKADTVTAQIPAGGAIVPNNASVIVYLGEEPNAGPCTMPNVMGLSAAQANKAITNAGLIMRMAGTTTSASGNVFVISQDTPEGTVLAPGDVVTVRFGDSSVLD